jgi:hypothetical protein
MTGHKKGEYQYLEPHDDLNMSQSTNDSYPTAIKVALILRNEKLAEELQMLVDSFRAKGKQYLMVTKMGRTELQDAVPMTVGQEFYAFASSLENEIPLLKDSEKSLLFPGEGAINRIILVLVARTCDLLPTWYRGHYETSLSRQDGTLYADICDWRFDADCGSLISTKSPCTGRTIHAATSRG